MPGGVGSSPTAGAGTSTCGNANTLAAAVGLPDAPIDADVLYGKAIKSALAT